MSDIMIFIRGGVFQGAVSNSQHDRIMVVDYDDEVAAGHIQRRFEPVPVARDTIARILSEAQGADQAGREMR